MTHRQPWQDETVQALKQGYQDEINKLLARIQELETAGRDGLTREYFEGFKVANQRLELILATAKETGLIDSKSVRKIMQMDAALLNNPPLEKE